MQKGICLLSVIPMRAAAESKSEMVSQLLFGETYDVLAQNDNWIQIKTHADAYEAWISANQYNSWDGDFGVKLVSTVFPYLTVSNSSNGSTFHLLPGSIISNAIVSNKMLSFQINEINFQAKLEGENIKSIQTTELITYAKQFINAPYLWGGRSFMGIDCSGFTQLIYTVAGIQIPRDAYQQAGIGEDVSFVNEALPGDLAFFDNAEGRITHVGMICGNGEIIHASGMVRIDVLDSYGIFNEKLGSHTHKLRLIKRLLK